MRLGASQLPLPLIVQAQALAKTAVPEVCWGLFQNPDEDYQQALQRLQGLVVNLLPRPLGRWLVCCAGLGSLLKALRAAGYEATGLSLEPTLPGLVSARGGESSTALPTLSWETLHVEAGGYRGVVFHDALCHLDLLALFGKAYRLLDEGGMVVILDEFIVQPDAADNSNGPRLGYLAALAERCGFELQEQQDLTLQAVPTLDYFAQLLAEWGPRLGQERELDQPALAAAQQSIRYAQRRYAEGRRAYQLIKLVKRTASRWRVSHAEPQDFPAIAGLFSRVFQQDMSRDLWTWKYGACRGQASIAWRDGAIVAHYGGLSRPILFFGQPAAACQIVDVMVEPAERGAITRKGPFFQTAASFAEVYLGYGTKHLLGFGFPNARVMKLAAKLNLYAGVGEITEICWAPDRRRAPLGVCLEPLAEAGEERLDRAVKPLWRAMRADLRHAIVGVRDNAWLRHRYFAHPQVAYETVLVRRRWTRQPLGIMVLRRQDRRCELLDVVAPLRRVPLLVREARRLADQWDVDELYCWISAGFAPLFECYGGERRALEVTVPTSSWVVGPPLATLDQRWWLMGGDTDFH